MRLSAAVVLGGGLLLAILGLCLPVRAATGFENEKLTGGSVIRDSDGVIALFGGRGKTYWTVDPETGLRLHRFHLVTLGTILSSQKILFLGDHEFDEAKSGIPPIVWTPRDEANCLRRESEWPKGNVTQRSLRPSRCEWC